MARGLVTRLEDDFMIIMTDQMTIEKIKLRTDIKIGQRIEYAKKDIYRGFRLFNYKKVSSMLALALVLVLTSIVAFGQTGSREIYAVVSVDINPSVELYLDQSGNVVDYRSFNEDGLKIVNKSLLDSSLEDALSELILQAQDQNYLINRDMILVSSSLIKTDKSTTKATSDLTVEKTLKSFMSENKNKYQFVYVEGVQRLENAKANKSLGRETLDTYEKDQSNKSHSSVETLVEAVLPNVDMSSEEPIEIITTTGTDIYEFVPDSDQVASIDVPTSNDLVKSTQKSMASRSSIMAKLNSNSTNDDLYLVENKTIKSLPVQASVVAVEKTTTTDSEVKEKSESSTPVSNNSSTIKVVNDNSSNQALKNDKTQTTSYPSSSQAVTPEKPVTNKDANTNVIPANSTKVNETPTQGNSSDSLSNASQESSKSTENVPVINTTPSKVDTTTSNEDNNKSEPQSNASSEIHKVVPQVTIVSPAPATPATPAPVTPSIPASEKPAKSDK